MLFEFRRDEEGREDIRVGGVMVARWRTNDGPRTAYVPMLHVEGVTDATILDAIERADEAGFWREVGFWREDDAPTHGGFACGVVTVEVPVADNAVLSVTIDNDES